MATETERLERETEQTRAQLEQTLGELRARMSPGHLLDQATDYFRNSGGRTYLHNLREEVVHNPVPITLIGAGIAWLAISGAMGRRGDGHGYRGRNDMARDWGRSAGIADDLAHGGHGPSAMQRAKQTAQSWAHEAGEAISETEERWRERAEDVGDRVSTAYDETIGRARQTAEDLGDEARTMAGEARETLHEGADSVRERAGELYERTASGFRRVTHRASEYGHVARDAVRPEGALLNFCREQPMLVAGLGVAFGAALAAMIPASRVERETMGDTSRRVQDRIKETAQDTWRAVGGERMTQAGSDGAEREQGNWSEGAQAANDSGSDADRQSGMGRSEAPSAARRESWQSESMGVREAAADVEGGVKQSDRASNIETEPSPAPYAEAAEAGAAGTMPGEETKQRT
jgi:Protein of unknown function (DUF3618)